LFFFFSSRRRHTRSLRDWSSDVCSSDLFHKRWRQFKNRQTRPANAQFFLVATLRSSDDQKETSLHATLTDFKDKDDVPRDHAARSEERRVGKECRSGWSA